jgi:DnaJ-domain-containing protein 1
MENNLFNMFKYVNLNPGEMMASMMRQLEYFMLEEVERAVRNRLDELKSQGQTAGAPKAEENMNPFYILGVEFDASEAEVKKAYRKKAYECHPDRGGSTEQMAKVNAAFEVICRFKGWKR